jgi:hypothetical protein
MEAGHTRRAATTLALTETGLLMEAIVPATSGRRRSPSGNLIQSHRPDCHSCRLCLRSNPSASSARRRRATCFFVRSCGPCPGIVTFTRPFVNCRCPLGVPAASAKPCASNHFRSVRLSIWLDIAPSSPYIVQGAGAINRRQKSGECRSRVGTQRHPTPTRRHRATAEREHGAVCGRALADEGSWKQATRAPKRALVPYLRRVTGVH